MRSGRELILIATSLSLTGSSGSDRVGWADPQPHNVDRLVLAPKFELLSIKGSET